MKRIVCELLTGVTFLWALPWAGCRRPAGPVAGAAAGGQSEAESAGKTGETGDASAKQARAALLGDLADVYLKHRKFADAAKNFRDAIEAGRGIQENAVLHIGLAEALKGLNRKEEAVRNLQTAAEIFIKILAQAKEDQKDIYYEKICMIYKELGRRDEAIEWAEKIAGEEKEPGSVLKLARLYALIGESALAIDTYKMLLRKVAELPAATGVKLEYADFLARSSSYLEARNLAEEVVKEATDKQVITGAKRLLLRIYDALGILDKVEIEPGGETGEEGTGGEKNK